MGSRRMEDFKRIALNALKRQEAEAIKAAEATAEKAEAQKDRYDRARDEHYHQLKAEAERRMTAAKADPYDDALKKAMNSKQMAQYDEMLERARKQMNQGAYVQNPMPSQTGNGGAHTHGISQLGLPHGGWQSQTPWPTPGAAGPVTNSPPSEVAMMPDLHARDAKITKLEADNAELAKRIDGLTDMITGLMMNMTKTIEDAVAQKVVELQPQLFQDIGSTSQIKGKRASYMIVDDMIDGPNKTSPF